MIFYANGDSHTAGAELIQCGPNGVLLVFKEDDSKYWRVAGTPEGGKPHPECLKRSYGQLIANKLSWDFACDAESASSNSRILRTTHDYLENNQPDFVVIGWATWEREEWFHEGKCYQITGSGHDHLPPELKQSYKEWVSRSLDPPVMNEKLIRQHNQIYELHSKLRERNIPHVFFNTFGSFANIKNLKAMNQCNGEYSWDGQYVDPYVDQSTYYYWLKARDYKTVSPNSHHFGPAGHEAWAEFLYEHYVKPQLTN